MLDKLEGAGTGTIYSTHSTLSSIGTDAGKKLRYLVVYSGDNPNDGSWANDNPCPYSQLYPFNDVPAGGRAEGGTSFFHYGVESNIWLSAARNEVSAYYYANHAHYCGIGRYAFTRSRAYNVRCVLD
jgi:hypothetical protein